MAIAVKALYNDARSTFGVLSSNPSFDVDFLRALRAVSNKAATVAFVSFTAPESIQGTIDVSTDYQPMVESGIIHYMSLYREWARMPKNDTERDFMSHLGTVQTRVVTASSNSCYETFSHVTED